MEVKGITVKTIPEFVKKRFPTRYEEWLGNLPPESRDIHTKPVFTASWYDIEHAVTAPTRVIADMFYNGDVPRASRDGGSFVAETAITGVHKAFVRIGSPKFFVSMASRAFSSYFRPAKLEVAEKSANGVVVRMVEWDPPSGIMEYRILGWIEKALTISGCKNLEVHIGKSLARGDACTEFIASWR